MYNFTFLFRWLRKYNVVMANEQASRALGKSCIQQDTFAGELLPFLFNEKDALVTKPAPCVFINDLKKYTIDLLDNYER